MDKKILKKIVNDYSSEITKKEVGKFIKSKTKDNTLGIDEHIQTYFQSKEFQKILKQKIKYEFSNIIEDSDQLSDDIYDLIYATIKKQILATKLKIF